MRDVVFAKSVAECSPWLGVTVRKLQVACDHGAQGTLHPKGTLCQPTFAFSHLDIKNMRSEQVIHILPTCVQSIICGLLRLRTSSALARRFFSRFNRAGGGGGNSHFVHLCSLTAQLFKAMVCPDPWREHKII